jgi:hypothetical protein
VLADIRYAEWLALFRQPAGCYGWRKNQCLEKTRGTSMTIAMRPLLAGVALLAVTTTIGVGKNRLSTCDRTTIRTWIREGTKDN